MTEAHTRYTHFRKQSHAGKVFLSVCRTTMYGVVGLGLVFVLLAPYFLFPVCQGDVSFKFVISLTCWLSNSILSLFVVDLTLSVYLYFVFLLTCLLYICLMLVLSACLS